MKNFTLIVSCISICWLNSCRTEHDNADVMHLSVLKEATSFSFYGGESDMRTPRFKGTRSQKENIGTVIDYLISQRTVKVGAAEPSEILPTSSSKSICLKFDLYGETLVLVISDDLVKTPDGIIWRSSLDNYQKLLSMIKPSESELIKLPILPDPFVR